MRDQPCPAALQRERRACPAGCRAGISAVRYAPDCSDPAGATRRNGLSGTSLGNPQLSSRSAARAVGAGYDRVQDIVPTAADEARVAEVQPRGSVQGVPDYAAQGSRVSGPLVTTPRQSPDFQ